MYLKTDPQFPSRLLRLRESIDIYSGATPEAFGVIFSAVTSATTLLSGSTRTSWVHSFGCFSNFCIAGSKGQTLDQLLAFLKTNTIDDLNNLSSQLVPWVFVDGSPSGGPCLCFANGVWVDQTLSLKPYFRQVLDSVYNAAANQADELIFANAIYFKGVWNEKFETWDTKHYDFHLLDGSKVQTPFMTTKKKQLVSQYDGFKLLGLPYLQGKDKRHFTMYVFIPNENNGISSLLHIFGSDSDFFDRHIPQEKVNVGLFFIPKFKISFGFEASDILKELGLIWPFTNGEGLNEMVDSCVGQNLYVSSIYHKSFVEVNEEGTEAAGASATAVAFGSRITNDKVDFVADHPFLFVIREDVSRAMLFMGQVVDPRC
ncbi:putative serpin family protein [Tanacetum coccineum]